MIARGTRGEYCFHRRAVLLGVGTFLFLRAGAAAYGGGAATSVDLEKVAHLVRCYTELNGQLETVIKAAEAADPNLQRLRTAYARMKHWYAQDLSPQKQEYLQWRHTTASVQEADHAFNRLKQLSGAIVFAREAEDPNAVPFLRDIALPMLIRHAKDPNAITGPHVSPREKNVDVLWQGYKRFLREKAAFSQKRLDQYVAENDIPHMIVRLASDMTRGETYIALYETAMAERTPKEARDLHQRVLAVCRELAEFLPEWNALMAMADGETKKILEEVRTDIVDSISPSDN